MEEKLYYIQHHGYCGNALFWWGEKSNGYVTDIRKAQKYTLSEAKSRTQRPEDTFWPCDYIDGLLEAQKLIIDCQYVNQNKSLSALFLK